MVRSILIGLQYSHDRFLPGIIIDLYQMHRYLLACGHHPGSILVVTDIDRDVQSSTVRDAIVDGVVDSDILSFIEDLRLTASLVTIDEASLRSSTVNTPRTVLGLCLTEALSQDEKVFVYYTGHGMTLPTRYPGQPLRGGCLMPDYTVWLMDDFLTLVVERCRNHQNLVCWFDCCGMGDILLPYRLVNGRFRLDQITERTAKRSTADILIITSTSHDEKSVASAIGSAFTRSIVRLLGLRLGSFDPSGLEGGNTTLGRSASGISHENYDRDSLQGLRSLPSLIDRTTDAIAKLKVGHRQTINVVASLPIRPELPAWLTKIGSCNGVTVR